MIRATVVAALLVVASGPSLASPAFAQPLLNTLRIIAPAAPGGGWDQTARAMQQAMQQAGLVRTVSVENTPGAAGTIGLARFIGAERGNGDAIMISGLIMLGGIVTHGSPVTLRDVTPIARLTGEYEVIVVPAASPFQSLADVIGQLKERPESISWGGGSAGGSDQILAGLVADAVGVEPSRINYIAFDGGGESLSAIVGGQVSLGINGLAELAPQIQAGAVRALGISSAARLPGLNVPTLREQGVNVEFENWRSVVAPLGISRADRQRLETALDALVRSAAWREALDRYRWLDRYLAGDAFARFVDTEEARVRAILKQLGTGKRETGTLSSAGPYSLVVLAGLAICGVASLVAGRRGHNVRSFDELRTAPTLRPGSGSPRGSRGASKVEGRLKPEATVPLRPMWWMGAGILLSLVLAERAGFVVASAILFWFTARAFDARHPLRDAAFAVGLSLAAYLLFARLLQLPLPAGVLSRWI